MKPIIWPILGLFCLRAADTLPPIELKIGGAQIDVVFREGEFDLPASALRKWIEDAAEAVTVYFGRFPVRQYQLRVNPAEGRTGVFRGTTWQREFGAFTRISVGQKTNQQELKHDWMMTHEMVHTGFPSVSDEHHWIEEGMATYVEPIARAQAGQLDAARVWSDMVRYMPQGEPREGDEGLDHTHTWARTYWGGALFLLDADVRIREKTHNRKGLQDALRGIVEAGGTIQVDWPIVKALQAGDHATGTTVLMDLYQQRKDKPVQVDLSAIWKELGIEQQGGTVVFHDDARLAGVRRAITNKHP